MHHCSERVTSWWLFLLEPFMKVFLSFILSLLAVTNTVPVWRRVPQKKLKKKTWSKYTNALPKFKGRQITRWTTELQQIYFRLQLQVHWNSSLIKGCFLAPVDLGTFTAHSRQRHKFALVHGEKGVFTDFTMSDSQSFLFRKTLFTTVTRECLQQTSWAFTSGLLFSGVSLKDISPKLEAHLGKTPG